MIKKVNVKGQVYKVQQVDKVDEANSLGSCCPKNKVIKIKKSMDKIDKQVTFLHEFYHALFFELSVHVQLSDDLGEIIVDQVAIETVRLFAVLKRSKT